MNIEALLGLGRALGKIGNFLSLATYQHQQKYLFFFGNIYGDANGLAIQAFIDIDLEC